MDKTHTTEATIGRDRRGNPCRRAGGDFGVHVVFWADL